ncbi:unnamed protein product [Cochlearia groenlandica]
MAMKYSPEDEIVTYYLKMLYDDRNTWPSSQIFRQSKRVYRANPLNHFKNQEEEPLILHDGRYFFVSLADTSCGRTDGCESGCWRIIGRDKVIRSEKKQEILGFKRILKFVEKEEEPRSVFRFVEREKRRVKDKRVWVMEEYRLASVWKQCYVICKIRLLNPNPLEFLLSNHFRGYYR